MEKPPGDYGVGYARPPNATKFGQRQQPQRRRRSKPEIPNILTLLNEPVPVARDGKQEKLHPHEVMMLSLTKRALKGEFRAIKAFFKECVKAGLLDPPPQARSSGVLVVPKWMPDQMFVDLVNTVGAPPWPARVYEIWAKFHSDSLAVHSEWYPAAREAHEHEYIRD